MDTLLAQLARAASFSWPAVAEHVLHLLCTFVLTQPVAFVYLRTHDGNSYSRTFVQSLVLLSLIVTVVMLSIGDSMARAFGLFGALALIRFRTPVKDARDAVFLFLAVAIGIAVGVGALLLAAVSTASALALVLWLHASRFGVRIEGDGLLRLRLPGRPELRERLDLVLRHYCRSSSLLDLHAAGGGEAMDLQYRLTLRDPRTAPHLLTDLRAIPGAESVHVLVQKEHVEP